MTFSTSGISFAFKRWSTVFYLQLCRDFLFQPLDVYLSQAVKLFCNLPNNPRSLTAREMSSNSLKMTHSFKRERERGCAKQADHLTSLPSPPENLHYCAQRRMGDSSNSVPEPRGASAECLAHLTSRCASNLLISFGSELWVQESRCIISPCVPRQTPVNDCRY